MFIYASVAFLVVNILGYCTIQFYYQYFLLLQLNKLFSTLTRFPVVYEGKETVCETMFFLHLAQEIISNYLATQNYMDLCKFCFLVHI